MASRWVLVLILAVIAGAFVSWFAPLGLYSCDVVFGAQECYITEDEFETTVVRIASGAGAFIAVAAGLALLALWFASQRRSDPPSGD